MVVDPGPARWTEQAHASSRGVHVHHGPGTHDGVNLAPSVEAPRGWSSDGVEPGHTPRPRVGRRVRMLLSFQRPSHLFGRGFLPGARPKPSPIPERTGEYSAQRAPRRGPRRGMMAGPAPGRSHLRPRAVATSGLGP
jgi:hypothetical protein